MIRTVNRGCNLNVRRLPIFLTAVGRKGVGRVGERRPMVIWRMSHSVVPKSSPPPYPSVAHATEHDSALPLRPLPKTKISPLRRARLLRSMWPSTRAAFELRNRTPRRSGTESVPPSHIWNRVRSAIDGSLFTPKITATVRLSVRRGAFSVLMRFTKLRLCELLRLWIPGFPVRRGLEA